MRVPPGTLTLQTKVPYGAQPSLDRNLRGLGTLVVLPEVQVGIDLGV